MKSNFFVLLISALLLIGLNFPAALAASSVNYLGKTTWTLVITDSDKPSDIGQSVTIIGGISKTGDQFYLFQGYLDASNGPVVLSGGGVMINNKLIFTLSASQEHTDNAWRDNDSIHLSIDPSTFGGTMFGVGQSFNRDTRLFNNHYIAGIVTLTGSPIPLSSNVIAPNLLLLQ